ncbi:MAG: hypothetical protein M3521_10995 [Acidobacteriota bacterium]|nr:hypothetical protein [Acidobacteriota bacterium]
MPLDVRRRLYLAALASPKSGGARPRMWAAEQQKASRATRTGRAFPHIGRQSRKESRFSKMCRWMNR